MANRRVSSVVAVAALVAAGAIVGATVLQSRNEHSSLPAQDGRPPVQLEFGFRRDPQAVALRNAQNLLDGQGETEQAAAIFQRYHSVEAQLGAAFASWTGPSSLGAVQQIAAAHPDDAGVLLNLGWAQYWAGARVQAVGTWQKTVRNYPDSPYAVDAADALHPGVAPGLPPIVFDPSAVPVQARATLAAGVRAWNLKEILSARAKLALAVRLAPHSAETLVAAAVARFSPAQPLAPFPHLGPLSAEFPQNPIVRLHLGVLLLWTRQVAKGTAQLRAAIAEQPASVYARQARLLLRALARGRSK